jgi:hypothetical protein
VLPTLGHTAVLELEEETHVNIQALAVSLRGVALNADHPLVICKQVLQYELGLSRDSNSPCADSGAGEEEGLALDDDLVFGDPPSRLASNALTWAVKWIITRPTGLSSAS